VKIYLRLRFQCKIGPSFAYIAHDRMRCIVLWVENCQALKYYFSAYEFATITLFTRQFGFLLEQQSSHYFANLKMMSGLPIPFRWPHDLSKYTKGRFISNEQIVLYHLKALVDTTIPKPWRLYHFYTCDEYCMHTAVGIVDF